MALCRDLVILFIALYLLDQIYELGWNWDDTDQLAHGCLAGHLLECGCQLTGGYFMHPGVLLH